MAQIPAGADCPGQLSRKQTGDAWELKARRWLEGKGLRFVAANVRGRGGEIDLIMKDGQTIVFVEVRYRQSSRFGGAAASVTLAKQLKCASQKAFKRRLPRRKPFRTRSRVQR